MGLLGQILLILPRISIRKFQALVDGARDAWWENSLVDIGAHGELHFAVKIALWEKIQKIEQFHWLHRDRTAKLCRIMVSKVQNLNPRIQKCKTGQRPMNKSLIFQGVHRKSNFLLKGVVAQGTSAKPLLVPF